MPHRAREHQERRRPASTCPGEKTNPPAWLPYHHCGHVALLGGPLPLVHLELSEDVEEWVLPHWGDREVCGDPPRVPDPGRGRVWVCMLPSRNSNQSANTGFGPKFGTNPPKGLRLALTKPGRGLGAHRPPDPARPPLRSPDRSPPPPGSAGREPTSRHGAAACTQLALPASAAARPTQGTQRAPSNGRLATASLPPSGPRDLGPQFPTLAALGSL